MIYFKIRYTLHNHEKKNQSIFSMRINLLMPKKKTFLNGKKKTTQQQTFLRKNHSKTYNYKEIAGKLGLNDASSRNQIIKNLRALQVSGTIQEIERGKYILTPSKNYYTGRVDIAGRGQGYIIVDDLERTYKRNNEGKQE